MDQWREKRRKPSQQKTSQPISPYTISLSYGGDADFSAASGSSTLTVNLAVPSFSNLSAPVIADATASTTISGHVQANAGQQAIPAGETVQITVSGQSETATLDNNDNFSTSVPTATLIPGFQEVRRIPLI